MNCGRPPRIRKSCRRYCVEFLAAPGKKEMRSGSDLLQIA